jgi:hypothetical protein
VATGDIWVCALHNSYDSDLFIKSFDSTGNEVFSQAINTPATYNWDYNRDYIGIIANSGIVVCIAGSCLYAKSPDDEEFGFIEYTFPYTPLGTVSQCVFSQYQHGLFTYSVQGVNYAGIQKSYYRESVDGVIWNEYELNGSQYGGACVYIDPATERRYMLGLFFPGVESNNLLCYTTDYITYTNVFSSDDAAAEFGNDYTVNRNYLCAFNDTLYILCFDSLSQTGLPKVVSVSIPSNTLSFLDVQESSFSIDLDFQYMWVCAVRLMPDGTPYLLLSEDGGTTSGVYVLSGDTFVRSNSLSGYTYWYSGFINIDLSVVDTPYGSAIAAGGSIYLDDYGIWSSETVLFGSYEHIAFPPLTINEFITNPWPMVTIESGPYVALYNEFWTEERLAIEQEYTY